MAFSNNWDEHLRIAAQKGADPFTSWDVAKDLGGNTLGGADAGLVGKYWAIMGGGRNEEWISANPTEFWQRQLRDAQNYFSNASEHYGNLRADIISKENQAKMAEMDKYKQSLMDEQGAITSSLLSQYNEQSSKMQADYAAAQQALLAQQQQASVAAAQQEQLRAQAEVAQKNADWKVTQANLGLSNVDADKYAGEQSQAAQYQQLLSSQLGGAGFDSGNLLSGYDPTNAINQARLVTENFDTYRNSLGAYEYSPELYGQAMRVQSEGNTNLSQFDSQVRDQLSQLGQVYSAYSSLGDINSAQGTTAQQKVGSLLGISDPTASVNESRTSLTNMGTSYNDLNSQLGMLYGDDTNMGAKVSNPNTEKWTNIYNQFEPAAQGLLSQYSGGTSYLHSLYGDLQSVRTGRLNSEASRVGGLLSEASGRVTNVLGSASNEATRLQDQYNTTASTLRSQRIAEGTQIRENQALNEFKNQQNRLMGLAATTLQKPALRTQQALTRKRPDEVGYTDPLNLTRGYSSLLGG